jgi:hypothetical protein
MATPDPLRVSSTPVAANFLGTWRNTQRKPLVIASAAFSRDDEGLRLRVVGAGADADWGEVRAESFRDGPGAAEPSKMKARFELHDREVRLHAWVKQGVLVFAIFQRFLKGAGRSDYFDREFLFREEDGPDRSS